MQSVNSMRKRKNTNRNQNKKNIFCSNRDIETKPNSKLPFFAYGILKPGEIAYSNIKCCIADKDEDDIPYSMKQRDGVPILLPKESENGKKTHGYKYYFYDNKKAYKIINQTISNKLYEWGIITIGTDDFNVLFGKCPNLGSDAIEEDSYMENYKGEHDLLFDNGLKLIRNNLKSENFYHEYGFLKLQMNYMLLWSAIDRYCKLKYNKESEHDNRMELANENSFIAALKIYASGKKYRTIYTDKLDPRSFDINKPDWCMNYYYTLRCNIVHRGKTSTTRDNPLLEQATEDLLNIFEYILEDTFNEK